ncbi:BlaI/MecI/CopY family transcriptional regulator [Saccharomonospora piscinae]|uniref:Penicillinase repressor n=1 Tax=Saccharomonospora piscinae TaxID=687388 RepID=A0A1V8ZZT8_SACPI|nr:BlaI/MecI/CopY family transcriptional regulator [Saccharomonospora piscinae]OQO90308.1 penicillinase repressor [Saccharomonospora piscinae]TLW89724.1 BlaI/MecI/CopY family transcriptional regulator [Saccharomonospora piscinae]
MRGLGELEAKVMDVLWSAEKPLRVRDVLARLDQSRPLAYTTVMTVLDNLHGKDYVRRNKAGRAYEYTAADSREEVGARLLRDVLYSSGEVEQVLLHFAESATPEESDILRRALRKGESS